jgi:hypothetical protein
MRRCDTYYAPRALQLFAREGLFGFDPDLLGTLIEDLSAHLAEALDTLDNRGEVISLELANTTAEAGGTIRYEHLFLADAPRVVKEVPSGRMACRVLKGRFNAETVHGKPCRLAAPPRLNHSPLDG